MSPYTKGKNLMSNIKRSVATTNFVVFGQSCVSTLPGDWGTPQQAERGILSPDSTKGWRAKGYPFPLLAKRKR